MRTLTLLPALLLGCNASAPPPSSSLPPAPAPERAPASDDAGAVLAATESALLVREPYQVEATITATGAVSADIRVELAVAGDKLRLAYEGTFDGRPVTGTFVSDGDRVSTGAEVPAHLREAVVIGWTRMGLLHNVAMLMAGKPTPDRAEGGVREWVEAANVRFAPPAPASSGHRLLFDIMISGQRAGAVEVEIEDRGRPAWRKQRVEFPGGVMEVSESYQYSSEPPAAALFEIAG